MHIHTEAPLHLRLCAHPITWRSYTGGMCMRSLAASSSASVSQGHSVLVRGACVHTQAWKCESFSHLALMCVPMCAYERVTPLPHPWPRRLRPLVNMSFRLSQWNSFSLFCFSLHQHDPSWVLKVPYRPRFFRPWLLKATYLWGYGEF